MAPILPVMPPPLFGVFAVDSESHRRCSCRRPQAPSAPLLNHPGEDAWVGRLPSSPGDLGFDDVDFLCVCIYFFFVRESRAVDMEFLCVVAGKHVWSVRVDLHILDNGGSKLLHCLYGNLIDAANIAALAALSTLWRPECTVGGDDGQQVTVHDPEVRDPLPLTIHHMPIAVTIAYFGEGNIVVLDPTYKEEAVMGGRMTAIVNSNGDVCAIQKAGGEGLMSSVTMQCLRIASVKAADITSKIKKAVRNPLRLMSSRGAHVLIWFPTKFKSKHAYDVLIWDVEAQPNRHAVLGASKSRPDLDIRKMRNLRLPCVQQNHMSYQELFNTGKVMFSNVAVDGSMFVLALLTHRSFFAAPSSSLSV
ncbi:Exosome complex component RRP45B [Zea mays]|uniref:Exosome complex component RRP45B n=1 Tax=Zea mays TaxID=4577 RepID=A0A317YEX7_MAIZE|nr:Exosome complex component RRP45B [Zea mays]